MVLYCQRLYDGKRIVQAPYYTFDAYTKLHTVCPFKPKPLDLDILYRSLLLS